MRFIELYLLGVGALIGVIHLVVAAAAAQKQRGDLAWNWGPRDEPRPLTGAPARLERAFANYRETFPIFTAAVVVAFLNSKFNSVTMWGCWIYVIGRAIYLPLYAFGIPVLRSIVWMASFIGILMIVGALFV